MKETAGFAFFFQEVNQLTEDQLNNRIGILLKLCVLMANQIGVDLECETLWCNTLYKVVIKKWCQEPFMRMNG